MNEIAVNGVTSHDTPVGLDWTCYETDDRSEATGIVRRLKAWDVQAFTKTLEGAWGEPLLCVFVGFHKSTPGDMRKRMMFE